MFSILFYIAFLVFTLAYFLVFSVVFVFTVPFDRKRKALHWFSKLWTECYFSLVPTLKISVEGKENVVKDRPYVVVVNHRSMLDILVMYKVPLVFRWVSKREVYKWPVFGWVLWMHGDITIKRGTAGAVKKMLNEGKHWLDMGVSVMVFPEGSRGKLPQVGRFHEGAFLLAKKSGVGILPCVAEGTGTAFNGWKLNFRNKYKVRILPEITAEQVAQTDIKTMTRQVHDMMASEYEKIIIPENYTKQKPKANNG